MTENDSELQPLAVQKQRSSVFELEANEESEADEVQLTPQKAQLVADYKVAGNNLFKVGEYEKAIEQYSLAIEIDPKNERLYSNRAAAYISLENWKAAIHDAETAIELNPDFAKAFTRLGTALKGAGLWKKAEEAYEKVLNFLNDEDADWEKVKAEIAACAEMIAERYEMADETDREDERLEELRSSREIKVEKAVDDSDEEESSEGPPEIQFPEKHRPTILEAEYWVVMFTNPGNISNMIGMAIMIAGFAVWIATDKDNVTG